MRTKNQLRGNVSRTSKRVKIDGKVVDKFELAWWLDNLLHPCHCYCILIDVYTYDELMSLFFDKLLND